MSIRQQKGNLVSRTAPDFFAERIEEFKRMFPEAITEGKIDFDKLKMALGEEVDGRQERYSFSWAGKKDAIRLLQVPSRATLIPAKEDSVSFDTTQNIFVEGENLEVLKLLWKSYFGIVKMIYIDPPYNTGKDFIYKDDYSDPMDTYLALTNQKDSKGNLLTSNPETSGRYHSAWLSMMYPRLFLARQLLRDDGVIFVSIDDKEVHNLRLLMNEVFGEENFIANVIWQKKYTRSNDARWFSDNHDHILVYARSKEQCELNLQPRTEEQKAAYSNPDNHPKGPWKATPLHAKSGSPKGFSYTFRNGVTWSPPPGTYPRFSSSTLSKLDSNNEIWFGKNGKATPARKTFLADAKGGITPVTIWLYEEVGHNHEANEELKSLLGEGIFENPKPTRLMKRMLELTTSEDDIMLDYFAGSCTAAQAVLELNHADNGNRRFIMIQLPEPIPADSVAVKSGYKTIADIGKERIRRAIARIRKGDDNQLSLEHRNQAEDLGFRVFKLSESNFRAWKGIDEKDPDTYAEQMELYLDPLIDGWTKENVLYELALKEGYTLASGLELDSKIQTNNIWHIRDSYKDQSFLVCLDDTLKQDTLRFIRLDGDNLFICRDRALNDEMAANLALQCRLKTI